MTDFKDILDLEEESQDIGDPSETHDAPFALLIEDIDRPQDRNLIYKVLSESQVDIDLEAVKHQLDEGHVLITHLNEAKASMIVDQRSRCGHSFWVAQRFKKCASRKSERARNSGTSKRRGRI